jgi:hypothetical protein
VKARNVWLVTFLVATVAMSLELVVYGWKETLLRFESFIVLELPSRSSSGCLSAVCSDCGSRLGSSGHRLRVSSSVSCWVRWE